MIVRLAENTDAPRIKELVVGAGWKIDVEFAEVYPYWLVAEIDDEIKGAIQVCPGKPMGRLELLSVDPGVSFPQRARIVRELDIQGAATLRKGGSELAVGMIPFGLKSYKKVLKKRGCVVIGQGNMVAKKL